jgi:hypothetical protein
MEQARLTNGLLQTAWLQESVQQSRETTTQIHYYCWLQAHFD